MSGTEGGQRGWLKGLVVHAVIGGVLGVLLTLLLMLGASALIAGGKLPAAYGGRCVLVCALLGAAVGAWLCAAWQGRGVLTAGLLAGAAYLLTLLLLAIFAGTPRLFGAGFLKIAICAVAGGAFGGTLRSRRKSKRRSRKRK